MKRTLALLMVLLLFLTSTAPTANVFAQSAAPETGGNAKYQTILETPNPTVENGKNGTLPSKGGAIHILYNSHNVKDTDMNIQVLKDGVETPFKFKSVIAHPEDSIMNGIEYSGDLPANDTTKDVVYKFYMKEKTDAEYDAKNVITITVKAKNTTEPTITGLNETDVVVKPNATFRFVILNINGENLKKDVVTAKTKKPADAPDITWIYSDSNGLMASAKMPDAPEDKDIVYTTTFSTANGSSQTVKITVKAKSTAATTEKTLTDITIDPEKLSKNGGNVIVTLKGDNLEPTDIDPDIRLKGELQPITPNWEKIPEGLKATLAIPKNTSESQQKYFLKFFLKHDTTKEVHKSILVTTEDGPATPAVPTVKSVSANPMSLPTDGGNVALAVTAEHANASDIQWTVKKDGVADPLLKPTSTGGLNFTLALPKNETEKDVVYTVEAKTAKDAQGKSATITVAKKEATPPVTPTSEIVMMTDVNKQIDAASSEETFPVIATPNTDAANVKLHITANGKDITLPYKVTGDKSRKTVTITFPENKTSSSIVYKITFNATGSSTVFQDTPVATFTQDAGEAVNASISEIFATNDQLPLGGGDTTVTIKGTDLDKAKLVTKLFKVENGGETGVNLSDYMKGSFHGVSTLQSASFTFPAVEKDTKFIIKVSVDGGNTFAEKAIFQTSEGSNRETEALEPKKVFTIDNDTLVVDFHEPVEEARTHSILKNVHILAGSDKIHLTADDKITFDGNTLRIDFKHPIFKDGKPYKLVVDGRTFKLFNKKENKAKENKEFESIIHKNAPYIEDAQFVEGYKLESAGGKVVLKLKGYNLPDNLKVKILENNKEKTDLNVTPDITGSANEKTITFNAPENTTDRVQTYSILVSTDGVQYSSEVSNMQNRFRRMVVSVLPKNADVNAPQIDFMQIQSYGNADDGDITHTNLPTGQESKKTLVWIYGANLNADHTRLRLIDKNGVYWSPIYDATQDSGTRILMTMLDAIHGGTPGMTGKGNNMLMEVILPRGYQPDNWDGYDEGTTFKYEVAPDGVNFDKAVNVTATVRFDHEDSKKDLSALLTDVTVRHVDKDGKDIVAPEKIKAYNHLHPCDLQKLLPLRDKDGFVKDFEGYKVADTDEIVKGKTGPNDYGTAYYDGKTVKDLKNKKGEIVLVYGRAKTPEQPAEPSKPVTPQAPDSSNTVSDTGYTLTPVATTKNVTKPAEKTEDKKEETVAPSKGYVAGYPDHTFRPEKSMTRAEAASMLARLRNLSTANQSKPAFTDADGWYNASINAVVEAGYMKGYPNGTFKPDQAITRAEFAQLLSYFLSDESVANPFADTANNWAKNAIDKAFAQNIVKGYGNHTFRPEAQITRAESIAMINRTFKLSNKSKVANPFVDLKEKHWAYNDILTAISSK